MRVDVAQGDVGIALAQLAQAGVQNTGHARTADRLAVLQLPEVLEEVLVMADLVGADAAEQIGQHRLAAQLAQRVVVGGGAGLDHAARHQFQARVGLQLVDRAQRRVLGEEAVVGLLPGKLGPHRLHVGLEGGAVLQLLGLPLAGEPGRHVGVGGVVLGQVAGVGVGAGFDERGADQQVEQRLVVHDGGVLDGRQVQVFQAPVAAPGAGHGIARHVLESHETAAAGGAALHRAGYCIH